MQIDNLTLFSILIFLLITIGIIFLLYFNYIRREKLKKIYTLLFTQSYIFYLRYIFLVLSLIIILLSIFKFNYYSQDNRKNIGIDVVFVLDVSKSMNTRDIGGLSRIDAAKSQIQNYVVSHPDNRYSLVIFAGDAISISPLSNNLDHFLNNLARVNFRNIATQGTNLAKALELGYARFGISDNSSGKALILISDGGDDDLNQDIPNSDIASFIFGVGSRKGGPIPIGQNPFGEIIYQTYQGEVVSTKLNSSILKQLANAIGGEYNTLENLGNQLDSIDRKAFSDSNQKYKTDLSYVLGWISLLLFTMYLLFPYYIRGNK